MRSKTTKKKAQPLFTIRGLQCDRLPMSCGIVISGGSWEPDDVQRHAQSFLQRL